MKISTASEAVVTTDVSTSRVIDMKISAKGMAHVMGLLTNLYKDPQLAVIREYYTNALDAQTKAGLKDRPVLVTLPTWDSPVYEVQDFGVGMDDQDMEDIYSQYGESTKQDSNEEIGAFGLGCKAALAIANQFTLVSNKNGKRTTCLVSKTKSGTNTVTIVSMMETDAENGTTVKIPIPTDGERGIGINSFNEKALKFFSFSQPGIVLVDGAEPASAFTDSTVVTSKTDPNFKVHLWKESWNSPYNETNLVMGNVPYVISVSEQMQNLKDDSSFKRSIIDIPKIIPTPIGAIDLTPSREGVQFTDKTNKYIESVLEEMGNNLLDNAKAEIDACTTLQEFWTAQAKWSNYFDKKELTWKGKEVPHYATSESEVRSITRTTDGSSSHDVGKSIYLGSASYNAVRTFLVEGASAEKYTRINAYIGAYMNQEDIYRARFVLADDESLFDNEWIKLSNDFERIKADDIIAKAKVWRKTQRELAKAQGTVAVKLKYPVLDVDEAKVTMVPYDEIPKKIKYLHKLDLLDETAGSDLNTVCSYTGSYEVNRLAKALKGAVKSKKILLLGGTRTVEALLKRIPTAVSLESEIKEATEAFNKKVTPEILVAIQDRNHSWMRSFHSLGVEAYLSTIKDKEVHDLVDPKSKMTTKIDELRAKENHVSYLRTATSGFKLLADWETPDTEIQGLADRYPLLTHVQKSWRAADPTPVDHVVTYMNAVYNTLQKTKGTR